MPTPRTGHPDAQQLARLNFLKGTTYPTAPTTAYLALFAGTMPSSDGTGGTEVTGTRPALTFGPIQVDPNGRHYMTNSSALTNITVTNASSAYIVGFGIYDASTAGNYYYGDRFSGFQVAAKATISIAVGQIRVYAEPPTIS